VPPAEPSGRRVERIDLEWRLHTDAALAWRELWAPGLSAVPLGRYGSTPAVLAPFALRTVLPLSLAQDLGLDVFEFKTVEDPLLFPLRLREWGRHPIAVYGRNPDEYLLVEMEIAFDESMRAGEVLLGQHFFHQVRLVLDGDMSEPSYIQTRPTSRT